MEVLPKVVRSNPQPMANPNGGGKEAYGYTGGQGSPVPGETASPKSYFQQSPSLPTSGLTESNSVDFTTCDLSPDQPPEPSARRVSIASPLQKQYVGVRVKMPVRELLEKIRLSKGTCSNDSKETSGKARIKETSVRAGKKRACLEKRPKQSRQETRAAFKSMEDLDMLVEVLQEDLDKSPTKGEPQMPLPCPPHGASPEVLPSCWWEARSNPLPDGNRLAGSRDSIRPQPCSSFPKMDTSSHVNAQCIYASDHREMHLHPDPTETLPDTRVGDRCRPAGNPVVPSMECFQDFAREARPCCLNPPEPVVPEPSEDAATTAFYGGEGSLKPSTGTFAGQDASALSFFQFQLHREESWLKNISVDKLLMPDKDGNSLLHKAVAQGKRALAYALAWRSAHLNRIDEKDTAKQTALHIAAQRNHHLIVSDLISLGANVNDRDRLGKTALHLCAEKGYLRVLEVLKNCQKGGTHVEVDVLDSRGFTPLQCAAFALSAVVMDLGNSNLRLEAQRFLSLRKDQMLSGINCLLEMGARPWIQGAKSLFQTSGYVAEAQENQELMYFLQGHGFRWQEEDPSLLSGLDGIAFPNLQGEALDPPLDLLSSFFSPLPEDAM